MQERNFEHVEKVRPWYILEIYDNLEAIKCLIVALFWLDFNREQELRSVFAPLHIKNLIFLDIDTALN